MWMIATFILGYAVFCMMAVPDGRRSERQYAKLPGAMSAILFLPLHLGKLTAYEVAAVIMQIGSTFIRTNLFPLPRSRFQGIERQPCPAARLSE